MMPITEALIRERWAKYNREQPLVERAKQRYDRRQEMLNDPEARGRYRLERWGELGQAYKASRSRSDPIHEIEHPDALAGILRQTFTQERATEIDEGMNQDYAGHVQDQEVKEFLLRRANLAQAAFEQHKMFNPEASDQDAYNKMYRTLMQYGFQPRGLAKLIPFTLKDGRISQEDYTPIWSEARSFVLGTVRGARRMATAPMEMMNAGLEMVSDIYNRDQAGAEITGSNVFRDARREFAVHMGAVEQALSPDDIPYTFDVAGIMGEQVPNMLATITGAKLITKGAKLAGNALAMGSMFAMEGADAYNNYMQYGERQGMDPRLITTRAYAGAMAYGAASAALERLIPVEMFKRIPGLKNRIAGWALGSLAEGTTEFLQSLTQAGIGEMIDLGQFDWDSIRQATREAAAGIIVGGVAGAATIGRATPQVDRLLEVEGLEEVKARIETELDTLKKRAVIREEVEPTVQVEEDIQTTSDVMDRAVRETTGLRSKLRKSWRAFIKSPSWLIEKIPADNPIGKLRDSIGRGLSDDYKAITGWLKARRAAKGRERRTTYETDLMGALWTKQLEAYGLDPRSDELQAIAEMGLRGEVSMDDLPPAVQLWIQTARTMQDAESINQARICRAAGLVQRAETIEKNIGSYLKNIPLAQVNTIARMKNAVRLALGLRTSVAFSKTKRDKWAVYDGKKLLGKFDTEAEARDVYTTTINQRKSQVIKKRAAEEGVSVEDINRKAAKNVKIVAPLPAWWRQKYEVHNPAFLLSASMVEARHDAEMIQLFNMAANKWGQEAPKGLNEVEADAWAKENGLVQLPQSGRLHDLKGIYVPRSIGKDLTDMTRLPGMAEKLFNAYMTAWKSSKTLWNPATHGRNIGGNILVFSYLARCSVLNPLNAKYYRRAVESYLSKDENFLEMLEQGSLGGEYFGGEIVRRTKQDLDSADDSALGTVFAKIRATQETLGKTYAAEDQIFKLAAYHKYKAEGMSPEVASEEVNKWFPNYERVGKITRWLRKSPIGAPFISFVDQSVRIAGRGLVEHPFRTIAIGAMPGILNYMAAIAIGLNPDEKELIDKERGYFEPLVPWRDAKGRTQYLDLRYIVPLANDIVPEKRGIGIQVPWMFSGPAATVALEQFTGQERFRGRAFIREGMTPKEEAAARAKTIALAAIPHPSFTYWGTKRIIGSITGDRDEHTANAIVGSLVGLNVRSPYIAEKHVKQVLQNMIDESDWREAEILKDVWNQRYKPGHLKNLTMPGLVKGLRQSKLAKWRKVRDEAAEAILQGRDDDAQEFINDYMEELGPGMRPLFKSSVEYRARQFRIEGKTQ